MRLLLTALVAALSLTWLMPEDVAAQSRGARAKKAQKQARVVHRSASVGQNGLCQRDTGTPTSSLNLRNRCDAEEFWNRMNDRSSAGNQ